MMRMQAELFCKLTIAAMMTLAGCGTSNHQPVGTTEPTPETSVASAPTDPNTEQESQPAGTTDGVPAAKTRAFRLEYAALLKEIPASAKVRVWLPVPQTSAHQSVEIIAQTPAGQTTTEPKYGNQIYYVETDGGEAGDVEVSTTYAIVRKEVTSGTDSGHKLNDEQRQLFLAANTKVPTDGKPLQLLTDVDLAGDNPLVLGRSLYDLVDGHVKYDKAQPGYGTGDSNWVCDSRFGNCTDFHSLFISLARSQKLPARFEIGFPLPPERGEGKIGGYHCWALFFAEGKGWVPVDISEADKHPEMKEYYFGNLTENRVAFSTGRDLTLEPKQAGPPLNYFVYPYVEVDGQVWPKEKIELKFSYRDQPET
ncbi:MAG TPA: transglutaminase [Planctomycetaceae bacterium]|nr:transglutaminase [Blastopirellula sp.]HAY79925.1 transglutaminase [Planctomycetaceae bacterium]